MRRVSLGYLTKEGFKNTWVNRLMSTASVTVLMSCLIMVGVAAMMLLNIRTISENIENQNVVLVFAQDETTDAQLNEMRTNIRKTGNIKSCVLVTKEEAFKEQLKELGAAASLFQDEKDNPLPDMFKVTLNDLSKFDETIAALKCMDNVLTIRENRDLANKVLKVEKAVTYISVGVIALLLLVSLFIISNTIKITMFSRKLEINIMKSVGATNWFVRWPFMIEGMVLGATSGVLSVGLVWLIYKLAVNSLMDVISVLNTTPVAFTDYALKMLICFVVAGMLIGALGSIFSIRKYLKEQSCITVSED